MNVRLLKAAVGLLLLALSLLGLSLYLLDQAGDISRFSEAELSTIETQNEGVSFMTPPQVLEESRLHPVPAVVLNLRQDSAYQPLDALIDVEPISVSTIEINTAESEPSYGTLHVPKIEFSHQVVPLPYVDGEWDTDDLGSDVALLEGVGQFPNDDKAMVFAGHVNIYWPAPGPFAHLDKLMPLDEIVYMLDDQKYVYQISQLAFVNPDQVDLILRDNGQQIVLLTCSQFNLLSGTFDQRLLVIADLVEVQSMHAVTEIEHLKAD